MSHYKEFPASEWTAITSRLMASHHLAKEEIVEVVLQSWDEIFGSKIGILKIGKDLYPAPQIMSFLLHELVAHHLSKRYPQIYKVGTLGGEKDVHCLTDADFSIEIKASSNSSQIFANRSYAQPQTVTGKKPKDGYYITINFESFTSKKGKRPEILIVRFGFLEHTDWIAQKSQTGQQARLSADAYAHKLQEIYRKLRKAPGSSAPASGPLSQPPTGS